MSKEELSDFLFATCKDVAQYISLNPEMPEDEKRVLNDMVDCCKRYLWNFGII